MALYVTPQGVDSPNFHPASFDHSFSVPGLYAYHAQHSPDHAVFTYSDPTDEASHDISYRSAWKSISRIAATLRCRYSASQKTAAERRPIVGILAHADTVTYIYTLVAIMSLGFVAFPIAPRNTAAVLAHLLKTTGARYLVLSSDAAMQDLAGNARALLEDTEDVEIWPMMAPEEYMGDAGELEIAHEVVDIADSDVTIILHSSGTTALPKPIEITRRGLVNLSNIPCFGEVDLAGKRIAAHTNPAFHAMGLGTLMWPLTSGATFALYKPCSPPVMPTPDNFLARCIADRCDIVFCVPVFIEAWARNATNLPFLQGLHCIIFSGASVSKTIGDMLAKAGVTLHPFWGSTEVGPATMFIPREPPPIDEWEYFKMSRHISFVMQLRDGAERLFEPIMIPTETCFPQVTNSELDGKRVYAVGDLLERHPTDPTRWKVFGRKDDQIMLSTGENVNPVPMEAIIAQDPHITSAVVFGRHRIDTGLLVEPAPGSILPHDGVDKLESFINTIWPNIERANALAPAFARIKRHMIIVTSPDKPLEHTPKGTARRGISLKLYSSEIDAVYASQEGDSYSGNRSFPDRV